MIALPYTLAGREIPDLPVRDESDAHLAPCLFCGRMLEHVHAGGIGGIVGALVDGESRTYLRCNEGPCATASAPWIWRCGCVPHYIENVGDRCHDCRRPRHEAEPYDRVERLVCGEARWLDDRLGIGNGRCLGCTGGPAYLPVLHEVPHPTSLAVLPGGCYGE
ncbi:MAG: hypothetical protein ACLQGP_35770 [Isosphaeraceae bacterium]